MIIEGLVTTLNEDGSANLAPMGPSVDEAFGSFVLRPFRTSTTYRNLRRHGAGVFHVTDDVELLARAAVDRLPELPPLRPAVVVAGWILQDACRWWELRVRELDDREERTRIVCDVVAYDRGRDFLGWNRAAHAVVEAAILATRLQLLPAEQVLAEWQRLAVIVDKTAGASQRRAFEFLSAYVAEQRER